jgi:hypothetical protein
MMRKQGWTTCFQNMVPAPFGFHMISSCPWNGTGHCFIVHMWHGSFHPGTFVWTPQ